MLQMRGRLIYATPSTAAAPSISETDPGSTSQICPSTPLQQSEHSTWHTGSTPTHCEFVGSDGQYMRRFPIELTDAHKGYRYKPGAEIWGSDVDFVGNLEAEGKLSSSKDYRVTALIDDDPCEAHLGLPEDAVHLRVAMVNLHTHDGPIGRVKKMFKTRLRLLGAESEKSTEPEQLGNPSDTNVVTAREDGRVGFT